MTKCFALCPDITGSASAPVCTFTIERFRARTVSLLFPECNAHLSWLLTDASFGTWIARNNLCQIQASGFVSVSRPPGARSGVGPSWLHSGDPADV